MNTYLLGCTALWKTARIENISGKYERRNVNVVRVY